MFQEDWSSAVIPKELLLGDAKYALTSFYNLASSEVEEDNMTSASEFNFDASRHGLLFPFQVFMLDVYSV